MKKKLLVALAVVAMLTLMLAISVSAETVLKPQDTDAYGELSFFDDSITVGRNHFTEYNFTPYMADGTSYARVVIGDGTTFYTFPTVYIISTSVYNSEKTNLLSLFEPNFTSLNSAMETETGTNPGWTKNNVYRIELPANMKRLNGGNQCFGGFGNVKEIFLQPDTTTIDKNKNCNFYNCYNLETIHNLDSFVFRSGTLGGSFQNCAKLTNITIGVSPEVISPGDNTFNGCTSLVSVNLDEAFPNLTSIGKQMFYKCSNLKSISSVGQEYAIIVKEGITSIGQQAFDSCNTFKYLSLPTSITKIGSQAFTSCKGLNFVDFNDNTNTITFENYGHFMGCSSLKAISFSDSIASMQNRVLQGCTSLEAVYLPANMPQMGSNGNGQGPFDGNTKMYFVQDSFEVRDANGNFFGDNFEMPAKPTVYYMPSTLATLVGHVRKEFGGTGGSQSGSFFQNCTSINDVIVFAEGFNYIGSHNVFSGIGTQASPKTVVFLGDIKGAATLQNAKYISFVFVNENDKTPSDLGIVYVASNSNNDESYMYFCSEDTKYNYHTSKSEITDAAKITEYISGLEKINEAKHVAKPELTEKTDPDCVTNALITTYCFCGAEMGTKEVEGTKLGHNHDLADGATLVGIVYADFAKEGNKVVKCSRCDVEDKTQTVVAIFSTALFSVKEDGTAICVSYTINNEAYSAFLASNKGASLEFGLVAAASIDAGVESPLDAEKKISHDLTNGGYTAFDLRLSGDWETQSGVYLSMALYTSYKANESAEATINYVTETGSATACQVVTYAGIAARYENNADAE